MPFRYLREAVEQEQVRNSEEVDLSGPTGKYRRETQNEESG